MCRKVGLMHCVFLLHVCHFGIDGLSSLLRVCIMSPTDHSDHGKMHNTCDLLYLSGNGLLFHFPQGQQL
ncbi:hypothetical protein KP509_29G029400 [Ceratopteris richardii]|uniref:Secreted protein n=1 Tax=Ceratopteris richardii TaxID=49495 RepID=A0A8T2R5N4_CERRI|nr:hypothetical protein KP509_29G029400 [Ceratopteris richardii]